MEPPVSAPVPGNGENFGIPIPIPNAGPGAIGSMSLNGSTVCSHCNSTITTADSPRLVYDGTVSSKYDTRNGFGLDANAFTFERFRTSNGLPPHIESTAADCNEFSQMCSEKNRHFIEPEPVSMEYPESIPVEQQIATKLATDEEMVERKATRQAHLQMLDDGRARLAEKINQNTHVWRRPRHILTNPSFFGPGNNICDAGPLGGPLPEYGMKYLPKFQQGIFEDTYFAAAVAMVCMNRNALANLFASLENRHLGMYTFQFYEQWEDTPKVTGWKGITIDDSLPCNIERKHVLGRLDNEKELWYTLLQKAYATFRGSYSYLDGGSVPYAICHLTGGTVHIDEWNAKDWKEGEVVEAGNTRAGSLMYDTAEASQVEVNTSLLWWKLVEGTYLGFMQAVCKRNRDGDPNNQQGIRTHKEGRHDSVPRKENEWDPATTHVVMQAVQVDTPGPDVYLVKMRNMFGETFWQGAYSNRSPEWTRDMREWACNKHVDPYITWMSIDDFMNNFNTLCTCTSVPHGPVVFFDTLRTIEKEGDLAYYAKQYLITVQDNSADQAISEPAKEAVVSESGDLVDGARRDSNSSRPLGLRRKESLSGSQASEQSGGEPISNYCVVIYISQPDLGAVDLDGHFLCGSPAKDIVAELHQAEKPSLMAVVENMQEEENHHPGFHHLDKRNMTRDDEDSPKPHPGWKFPSANKKDLNFEFQDTKNTKFRMLAEENLHPGTYVLTVHQKFHKDEIPFLLAVQGEDTDESIPTGFTVSVKDLGTWGESEAAIAEAASRVEREKKEQRTKKLLFK